MSNLHKMNLNDTQDSHPADSVLVTRRAHEQKLKDLLLPGWYHDLRGVPCILCRQRLVSLFVEQNGDFAVTVDTLDATGNFTENIFWETRDTYDSIVKLAQRVLTVICKQSAETAIDHALHRLETN